MKLGYIFAESICARYCPKCKPDCDEDVSSFALFHRCCHLSLEITPLTELEGTIDWIREISTKSSLVASSMSGAGGKSYVPSRMVCAIGEDEI